jgi:opacity protein-like surface antigen
MKVFHDIAGFNKYSLSGKNHFWDADPIVTDSIGWEWNNLFDLVAQDIVHFQPAVVLGYWHDRNKRMKPGNNNHPMNYDDEKIGFTWETSSFHFGAGTSLAAKDYVKFWLEYKMSTLRSTPTGDSLSNKYENVSKRYNRFGLGFTTNLNSYPAFRMPQSTLLYITCGFLFMQENPLLSTYRGDHFTLIYPIHLNTKLFRYNPWESMKHDLKTTVTSIGLGLSLLDKMFNIQTNFGIIRQQYTTEPKFNYKGFEFGFDLVYNKIK